jgi:hypothetical protein
MSSPKRREAIVLTYASLLACVVFWILDAFKATKSTTSGIISSLLESLFDVFSTLLVCWRLRRADCFEETPENIIAEARTSVLLSACMVGIAFVLLGFTSFSVFEAHKNEKNAINHSQLGDEVSLSFPSAIIYLVIGMLQAGMGCSMRVRSLLPAAACVRPGGDSYDDVVAGGRTRRARPHAENRCHAVAPAEFRLTQSGLI